MGKKILIIDDEPNIKTLLGSRLKANGFEVASASDPIEGFKKIIEDTPDLIILDVLMPEMTGYEFLNFIKKKARDYMHIPVIVISARQSMENYFNSWDIFKFIPKPFTQEILMETINEALGRLSAREQESSAPKKERRNVTETLQEAVTEDAKSKILVFSEDYGIIETLHGFLNKKYDVKAHDDLKDTIEYIKSWRPDLLLIHFFENSMALDFNSVLKKIKEEANKHLTKILAVCPDFLISDARKELKNTTVIGYMNMQDLREKLDKFLNVNLKLGRF